MNREIKFRAWDKDKGIMNYNIQGYYDNLGWDYYPTGVDTVFADFLDNEYQEVMQYIGLKDKNGKECYWDDWVTDGINPKFLVTSDYHLLARLSEIEFEIVGNKYETA